MACDASPFAEGAIFGDEWILKRWSQQQLDFAEGNIAVLDTLILILAASTWGHLWSHKRIRIHLDSAATVAAVEQPRMKDDRLMELQRTLHFIEACCNVLLSIEHIPGKESTMADDILRSYFKIFRAEHKRVIGRPPNANQRRLCFQKG